MIYSVTITDTLFLSVPCCCVALIFFGSLSPDPSEMDQNEINQPLNSFSCLVHKKINTTFVSTHYDVIVNIF